MVVQYTENASFFCMEGKCFPVEVIIAYAARKVPLFLFCPKGAGKGTKTLAGGEENENRPGLRRLLPPEPGPVKRREGMVTPDRAAAR